MSIEVGSKWVKDGEVVKVTDTVYVSSYMNCVVFMHSTKTDYPHIITERDFLEQYKPYEPVYEYQYVLRNYIDCPIYESQRYYKDDNEFLEKEVNDKNFKTFQRLDFTKRERT